VGGKSSPRSCRLRLDPRKGKRPMRSSDTRPRISLSEKHISTSGLSSPTHIQEVTVQLVTCWGRRIALYSYCSWLSSTLLPIHNNTRRAQWLHWIPLTGCSGLLVICALTPTAARPLPPHFVRAYTLARGRTPAISQQSPRASFGPRLARDPPPRRARKVGTDTGQNPTRATSARWYFLWLQPRH